MRVLLADDDPHVRSALRLVLENEPGISIVGEWATAEGLIDQVVLAQAEVVVFDWDLPGLRSPGELERLCSLVPAPELLALSGRPEQRAEALRAGVGHFVCKGDAPECLLSALRGLNERGRQT